MRTLITNDPYPAFDEGKLWIERGTWPCKWVCCKDAGEPPFATAYRKRFTMEKDATVRIHVSADERYELFLDGERIGRGSERSDRMNWRYETYDIPISKGDHVFVARVWSLGRQAPYAQMTVYPGFIFAPETDYIDKLGTGVTEWEAKKLSGYEFTDPFPAWGTGANLIIHGDEFSWGFENGEGEGWSTVHTLDPGTNGFIRNEYPMMHLMKPATLPPMMEKEIYAGSVRFVSDKPDVLVNHADNLTSELDSWNLIKGKGKITVPANTIRRVIIDLDQYYCAYPEVVTSGGKGSSVRLFWAEALYTKQGNDGGGVKENRNEIESKTFWGVGDTFKPDGGRNRRFGPLWWQAGRYIELLVQAAAEPLTIESIKLRETRYPLEMESKFESSDARLASVIPIALRALQMCSHETFLDCPYYEQLQYDGDTRLAVLTTMAITHDDKLSRQALRAFDASRHTSGVTESRFPCRMTQIIPPFSLWWVGMVYDYSLWRDDFAFIKSLMPGVRGVIDYYLSFLNKDGLVENPTGWNFMDWVPAWSWGLAPGADGGVSGLVNWQFVNVLGLVAELEDSMGEIEMAARARRIASELAARLTAAFWDDKRSLFADDLAKEHFSEHSQCMAILSGQLDSARREKVGAALISDSNMERTTISFTHYLFETYKILGRIDKLIDRMELWFGLEKLGLKTAIEAPEPSRSDCHGWAAHPIYHYLATILGIRPGSKGFATVIIEPQLGPLASAKGTLVHPKGEIEAEFQVYNGALKGSICLPEGVTGTLIYNGKTKELAPGKQEI